MEIDFQNSLDSKVIGQNANLSGWSVGLGIGYRFGDNNRHD